MKIFLYYILYYIYLSKINQLILILFLKIFLYYILCYINFSNINQLIKILFIKIFLYYILYYIYLSKINQLILMLFLKIFLYYISYYIYPDPRPRPKVPKRHTKWQKKFGAAGMFYPFFSKCWGCRFIIFCCSFLQNLGLQ